MALRRRKRVTMVFYVLRQHALQSALIELFLGMTCPEEQKVPKIWKPRPYLGVNPHWGSAQYLCKETLKTAVGSIQGFYSPSHLWVKWLETSLPRTNTAQVSFRPIAWYSISYGSGWVREVKLLWSWESQPSWMTVTLRNGSTLPQRMTMKAEDNLSWFRVLATTSQVKSSFCSVTLYHIKYFSFLYNIKHKSFLGIKIWRGLRLWRNKKQTSCYSWQMKVQHNYILEFGWGIFFILHACRM